MIKKRKQGEVIPTGLSRLIDDKNAYINLSFLCWMPNYKRVVHRYDWIMETDYYDVGLEVGYHLYFRIRKWSFCRNWPNTTLFSSIRKIFIISLHRIEAIKTYSYFVCVGDNVSLSVV